MSLHDQLIRRTIPGELYRQSGGRLECYACAHRCRIAGGKSGICKVRYNKDGVLFVPSNYVAGLQADPIEKKPFFHAYPDTYALSFGMLGCDLHCSYCQNWVSSQALRDSNAGHIPRDISAETLVNLAGAQNCRTVISTYNEPLITSEWAVSVFKLAKVQGLATGYVSNGNATPEVLDYLRPYTDLYKIDLKTFDDANYRSLGARLDKILTAIEEIHKRGFWLELVTLLVPGFNDGREELSDMASFIASLDVSIPWHITAYHPDYRMRDRRRTSPKELERAARIGINKGLNYVYTGNLPGQVGEWEHTKCHNCNELLIERIGFSVRGYHLDGEGCPACRSKIPGRWEVPGNRTSDFIRVL